MAFGVTLLLQGRGRRGAALIVGLGQECRPRVQWVGKVHSSEGVVKRKYLYLGFLCRQQEEGVRVRKAVRHQTPRTPPLAAGPPLPLPLPLHHILPSPSTAPCPYAAHTHRRRAAAQVEQCDVKRHIHHQQQQVEVLQTLQDLSVGRGGAGGWEVWEKCGKFLRSYSWRHAECGREGVVERRGQHVSYQQQQVQGTSIPTSACCCCLTSMIMLQGHAADGAAAIGARGEATGVEGWHEGQAGRQRDGGQQQG